MQFSTTNGRTTLSNPVTVSFGATGSFGSGVGAEGCGRGATGGIAPCCARCAEPATASAKNRIKAAKTARTHPPKGRPTESKLYRTKARGRPCGRAEVLGQRTPSVLGRRLDPSLRAPRLQQLVLAGKQPFHGRIPIDALDAVLRDDQLVTVAVSAQTRFAGFSLRATHEHVQHGALV